MQRPVPKSAYFPLKLDAVIKFRTLTPGAQTFGLAAAWAVTWWVCLKERVSLSFDQKGGESRSAKGNERLHFDGFVVENVREVFL